MNLFDETIHRMDEMDENPLHHLLLYLHNLVAYLCVLRRPTVRTGRLIGQLKKNYCASQCRFDVQLQKKNCDTTNFLDIRVKTVVLEILSILQVSLKYIVWKSAAWNPKYSRNSTPELLVIHLLVSIKIYSDVTNQRSWSLRSIRTYWNHNELINVYIKLKQKFQKKKIEEFIFLKQALDRFKSKINYLTINY